MKTNKSQLDAAEDIFLEQLRIAEKFTGRSTAEHAVAHRAFRETMNILSAQQAGTIGHEVEKSSTDLPPELRISRDGNKINIPLFGGKTAVLNLTDEQAAAFDAGDAKSIVLTKEQLEIIASKQPNAKTAAAIAELESGNGTRVSTVAALMADLESDD
jgi:hypothetical protein